MGGDTRLLPGRRTAAAAAPLALGSTPAGRFRIDAVLAVGSMGTVYRAADLHEGEAPRALKELPAFWGNAAEQEEAVAWFAREGDTLRGLDHPAIPRVYETFSVGPRHYLVMDLIEGETLEQIMAAGAGGLPEDQVVGWADQVLDVLSYLHGKPIPLIFRDMKPANLMRTSLDRIRLIDFGIARVFARRTQGTAIGTPGYAPPEQYQGLAEPASDLYALGATMHHLLTGRDPRNERLFDFPPVRALVPGLSSQTAAAIDRSLILDPRHRFDTAADMHRALHAGTPLASLPRLTQGTRAPTAAVGASPPLPTETRVEVHVVKTGYPVPNHTVRLLGGSDRITHGGVTLVASADRLRLELHNHTDDRLACLVTCRVPWLVGDPETAWLEPHGLVEFALSPTPTAALSAGSQAGDPADTSSIMTLPTAPTESYTFHLRVEGADIGERIARLTIMPGLLPLSIVALSSALAVLIVAFAHLSILAFYALEVPALALAVRLQWRRRKRLMSREVLATSTQEPADIVPS